MQITGTITDKEIVKWIQEGRKKGEDTLFILNYESVLTSVRFLLGNRKIIP